MDQRRSGQKICLPASLAGDERTQSLPWLLKDIQSRSRFLEQWILHGGAAKPHLLCSCSVKHLICCTAGSFHSSPSLCQHSRAVEIQPPFPGE